MDIEYVRSRFIKHFDGTTGSVLLKSNLMVLIRYVLILLI